MENIKIEIGKRLRDYRHNCGYTLEELAHKAEIHPGQIGKIERGESNFTIETLNNIVKAMDLPYNILFNFSEDLPSVENPLLNKTVSYLKAMTLEEQEYIYNAARFVAKK